MKTTDADLMWTLLVAASAAGDSSKMEMASESEYIPGRKQVNYYGSKGDYWIEIKQQWRLLDANRGGSIIWAAVSGTSGGRL